MASKALKKCCCISPVLLGGIPIGIVPKDLLQALLDQTLMMSLVVRVALSKVMSEPLEVCTVE